MQFTGTITHITPIEHIGEKETPKFTLVLAEQDVEYPKSLAVDVRGDKTQWHDQYAIGEEVTVSINHKSREHKGRHYNSISAWKIEKTNDPVSNHDMDEEAPF